MNTNAIRDRAHHYLSDDVARAADMRLHDLLQFVAYNFSPSDIQLKRLANRMQMTSEEIK